MNRWQEMAGVLLGAFGEIAAQKGGPVWFQVFDDPTGGEDYDLRLGCDLDILGWSAPPACRALAIVATGTVDRQDGGAELPIPIRPGRTRGVRMACVVSRENQIGWMMRLPDGNEMSQIPTEGRLLDCLRRSLDLPTPPPPATPAALQSILWLTAILDEGDRVGRRLSWRDAIKLHPVVCDLVPGAASDCTERDLFDLIRTAGSLWTWTRLREDTLINHWASEVVPDHVARWMDDGMFSRWILAQLPEREDLIRRIRPFLAPGTARRIAHAVRAAA